MVKGEPLKFTFEEARDIVLEAVKPMGEEYVNDMKKHSQNDGLMFIQIKVNVLALIHGEVILQNHLCY